MNSDKFKVTFGYILICLIWGSTWLAIKVGLDYFTPLAGAGFRFTSAAVIFFIIIKIRNIEVSLEPLALKIYGMLALFSYILPFSLVYWAEKYVPTGLTSILFGVLPFFVVIFSKIFMPESRVGASQWTGVALGFTGLFIIFSKNLKVDIQNDFWGMLAVFGSAIMQAFVAVMMKKHSKGLNPLSVSFLPTLIAGPVLILAGFIFEGSSTWVFNAPGIISFLYLALFGTVIAFSTHYWLMKKINIVILSLNTFITPIVAVLLGVFILNETFTMRDIVGSSFVLIGILFANFTGIINYLKNSKSAFKA